MLTNANYDDIIICEIRRGSVIVSFMIKNRLIPKLEEKQHNIAVRLEQDVMKVKIQDNIIYESGMVFFYQVQFLLMLRWCHQVIKTIYVFRKFAGRRWNTYS